MRRLDPEMWRRCRTCQQDFDYSPLYKNVNLPTALLSYALDHRWALRSLIFAFTSIGFSFFPLKEYYHRALTSTMLWQLVLSFFTPPPCPNSSHCVLVSSLADHLSPPSPFSILVSSNSCLLTSSSLSLSGGSTRELSCGYRIQSDHQLHSHLTSNLFDSESIGREGTGRADSEVLIILNFYSLPSELQRNAFPESKREVLQISRIP
jgi:hypothetical protein